MSAGWRARLPAVGGAMAGNGPHADADVKDRSTPLPALRFVL
jgi:hypothetical protein